MGDIAGLLALMQGNKGMDLPGLMALAREKGYDKNGGGEGMFIFVFLLLFLFAGGGWNGLNRGQQADFAALAGTNTEEMVGLHDRIADARAASSLGFQQLQAWLCESISNVIAVAGIVNRADSVARDVKEGNSLISAKIELEALKAENARNALESRVLQGQKDGFLILNQRFDQLENKMANHALAEENARLTRENVTLRDVIREDKIADKTVARLEGFALRNYAPTRTSSTADSTS